MKNNTIVKQIPILSFFSGGGFLDLGFEKAGFNICWSNEVQESYAHMYQAGISSWRKATESENSLSCPSVNLTSIEKLTKHTIFSEAFGAVLPDFFGVIGGPPCQDFSQAGKYLGVEGERGKLTQVFIDLIRHLRPSFFMMENVPGLQRKKHRPFFLKIVKELEEGQLGYLTSARILNALDYGVPQHRERLFLVGFRKDIATKGQTLASIVGQNQNWFPWPHSSFENAKALAWPTTSPFGYGEIPRPENVPIELTVGQLVGEEAEELPNGQEFFVPHSNKFKEIHEGDVSGKSFKRLHRYRYSPTVWYGNNEVHLHPWKPRRLTVREALRIQTVPDQYTLPPESTLSDKFRVISNGVPTLLAQNIAESLLQYIASNNLWSEQKVRRNR